MNLSLTPFTAEEVRAMIFELAHGEFDEQFLLDNDSNEIIYYDRRLAPFEVYKMLAKSSNFSDFLSLLNAKQD